MLLIAIPETVVPEGAATDALNVTGWLIIIAGIALGGGLGLYAARGVKMTAMPQLVSLFNAVGGGAAALIAIDDYPRPLGRAQPPGQRRDGPRHRHRLDHLHRFARSRPAS